MAENMSQNPAWRRIFFEVSCTSILKTHNQFIIHAYGAAGNTNFPEMNNVPYGIEIVPERTVCSNIYLDCLSSKLFNGFYKQGNELRYYDVDSEHSYPKNKRQSVDLWLQRYIPLNAKRYPAVYIEAKRAFTSSSNLTDNKINLHSGINSQLVSIANDISKLSFLAPAIDDDDLSTYRRYILVWGVKLALPEPSEKDYSIDASEFNTQLTNKLKNEWGDKEYLKDPLVKYIPISWKGQDSKKQVITKWIWVSFSELREDVINLEKINTDSSACNQEHIKNG